MKGVFHDLTGQRFGQTVVLRRALSSRAGARWVVRCDCGVERVIHGGNLKRRRGDRCGLCAKKIGHVTRALVEVLVLALEHAEISAVLVRDEIGWSIARAGNALLRAEQRRMILRHRRGHYRLLPRGLQLLTDIVEGRRADRFGVADEIRAAFDVPRASGRTTVRGAR